MASSRRSPIAELQRLQGDVAAVQGWLAAQPDSGSHVLTNALLNVAVSRLVATEGSGRAATILLRLAHAVAAGPAPEPANAVSLTALDS